MADEKSKAPEPQSDDNKGHQSYPVEAGKAKVEKAEDVKGHQSYPVEGK
jgi:hypothetical protein